MVFKNYEEMRSHLKGTGKKTVAVAAAHDAHTLEAVLKAGEEGILDSILIGNREKILQIGSELGYEIAEDSVIDAKDDAEAADTAVRLVREGKADFIQKGLMQTATILKAVVNKETGISNGVPISHTALLEVPHYHKLIGVTDGGMILYPDYKEKKAIVCNAVDMFHKMGYEKPMVAAVCPVEVVNPKMQETVDAKMLKDAADAGEFGECCVEGPISMDLAISKESAEIKGYESPVTGETDIFLVPNISVGNIMVKSLLAFGDAKMAGCVVGAKCPIALNSRSASFEEKYNSLMACAQLA